LFLSAEIAGLDMDMDGLQNEGLENDGLCNNELILSAVSN